MTVDIPSAILASELKIEHEDMEESDDKLFNGNVCDAVIK